MDREFFVAEVAAEIVDHAIEGIDELAGRGDRIVHRRAACDAFEEIILMDCGEITFGNSLSIEQRCEELGGLIAAVCGLGEDLFFVEIEPCAAGGVCASCRVGDVLSYR